MPASYHLQANTPQADPQRRMPSKNAYQGAQPQPHIVQKAPPTADLRNYNYTSSSQSPSYNYSYNTNNYNYGNTYTTNYPPPASTTYTPNAYVRTNTNLNTHPKTIPLREQEATLYTNNKTNEQESSVFVPAKAKAGKLVCDEHTGELLVSLTCPHCNELVAYWYTREKVCILSTFM